MACLAALAVTQFRASSSLEPLVEAKTIPPAPEVPEAISEPGREGARRPTRDATEEAPRAPTAAGKPRGTGRSEGASVARGDPKGMGAYAYDAAADLLSLTARDVPLMDLLETISNISGLEIKQVVQAGFQKPITVTLESVSLEQAMNLLLADFEKLFFYGASAAGTANPTPRLSSVLIVSRKQSLAERGLPGVGILKEPAYALLQAVQSEDPESPDAVAQAISESGGSAAIEKTVGFLVETDEAGFRVYRSAIEALGRAAPDQTIDSLLKRLQEPEASSRGDAKSVTRQRTRAVRGLGLVGDERALEPLRQTFQDKDAEREVRVRARESIQLIGRREREQKKRLARDSE